MSFLLISTLLFLTLAVTITVALYYYFTHTPGLKNIPTQKGNSILGFTNFQNEKIMRQIVEEKGPLIQFRVLGKNMLLVADKCLARAVLRDIQGKGFFHNATPELIPDSIFSLDTGPEWHHRRSTFRKSFSTSSLRVHLKSIQQVTRKLCTVLDKAADDDTILRIDDTFTQLTIGVICEVAFEMDARPFDDTSNYCTYIDGVLKELFQMGWVRRLPLATYLYKAPIYPFNVYRRARYKYTETMRHILSHIRDLHRKGELREGGLAMSVLKLADEPNISEDDIVAEIGTFFIAGMDTTAHTLAFVVYCLARYPSVQKRCQEEVDAHMSSTAARDTLPPYVEAVLKESMRKYPTAATGSMREVKQKEGYQLTEDIFLPHGWWVVVNILCLQNYSGNWGPDVDEFKPERWLEQENANEDSVRDCAADPLDEHLKTRPRSQSAATRLSSPAVYAGCGLNSKEICFAPFSYGIRNCVGMNLALVEMRVALNQLISRYSFELGDMGMLNEDNLLETSFTMRPQNGLPIRVKRRG